MLPATSEGPEDPEPDDVPAAASIIDVIDDILKRKVNTKFNVMYIYYFFQFFIN